VITGDVITYNFEPETFDRVISIELFEHMKTHQLLLARVAKALKPQGKLFVHIFAHKESLYDFGDGWMSTHFFTGGTMPSADLLHFFQDDLTLQQRWWISGKHYARTCEDWLAEMNASKKEIWKRHMERRIRQCGSIAGRSSIRLVRNCSHTRAAIRGVYATISS
jgi:cation-transporting ATPase 13A2